jgi:hypothetical protein
MMLPNSATLFGGGNGWETEQRDKRREKSGSRAAQAHGEKMRGRWRGNKQITLNGWFFYKSRKGVIKTVA